MNRLVSYLCALCLLVLQGQAALAGEVSYSYLDGRIELLMRRSDMMGLSVGVVENDQLRFLKGYGWTESGGQHVSGDTVFRWASMSKGLAGSLAAELSAEGKLSLDVPLSTYRTTLRLPGFGEQKATVRDLLAHRLGLEERALNRLLEKGANPSLIRAQMTSAQNVCAVGTCYSYQNVAFDTITEVFSRATGNDFTQLADEKVFRPLGMSSASTTYSGLVGRGMFAKPHSWSGATGALYRDGITLPYFDIPAAAGVSSSVRDMTKFMQAQFGTRQDVFRKSALLQAQSRMVRTPKTTSLLKSLYPGVEDSWYGLGWRIYQYRGHTLIGHEGTLRGTRATMLFDPEKKAGIVVAWNSNVSRPVGLQFEFFDMLYGDTKRDLMRLMPKRTGAP